MDVNHGQRGDAKRDEDPSSTEEKRNDGSHGEGGNGLQQATRQRSPGGMSQSPMSESPPSLLRRESLWDCIGKPAWTQAWFER